MLVSPSILTCDFSRMDKAVALAEQSGADMLHLDVMDGHFVPNLTFGPPVIRSLRKLTGISFDVHLMVSRPDRLLGDFADAGADGITVHAECESPIERTLRRIRDLGKRPAISLKPQTPASAVFPYLELVDMVLVMTVEPGFGGQAFMPEMLRKVRIIREENLRRGTSVLLEVDGGVNGQNAAQCAEAGADIAVIGSALFRSENPGELIASVQRLGTK